MNQSWSNSYQSTRISAISLSFRRYSNSIVYKSKWSTPHPFASQILNRSELLRKTSILWHQVPRVTTFKTFSQIAPKIIIKNFFCSTTKKVFHDSYHNKFRACLKFSKYYNMLLNQIWNADTLIIILHLMNLFPRCWGPNRAIK